MSGSYEKLYPICYRNCFQSKPYEPYYMDPVYDVTDNFGAFDADNPIGDGF